MLNSSAVAKFGFFCNTIMVCVSFTFANVANADSFATKIYNVGVFLVDVINDCKPIEISLLFQK